MRSNGIVFLIGLVLFGIEVQSKTVAKQLEITSRSCLDYLKKDFKSNGYYTIYDYKTNEFITVYCDMTSEAGSAWTLVLSYALKNRVMTQFRTKLLAEDAPVNEHSPNWNLYRMSLSQMTHLKSQSTYWRATCSFPTYKVDYTDYVRAKFADFDIMTFLGTNICKKVEYVNIRGHQCAQCTSKWHQIKNSYTHHIDSTVTGCQFSSTPGSASSEDNFGFYGSINNKFRCSSSPLSTTNWWFGGYL